MVLDGKEGAEYEEIGSGSPALSFDGEHTAYSVREDRSWSVIVDGRVGPKFVAIMNPSFSPDGNHISYGAITSRSGKIGASALVVDGQEGTEYSSLGNWAFSLDGKHLAYVAQTHGSFMSDSSPYGGGEWSVILDGHPGPNYSVILPRTLVFDSEGHLEFLAIKKEHSSFDLDNQGSLYRVRYIPAP